PEARTHGARAPVRGDQQRTPARADRAGARRDRSPDGGDQRQAGVSLVGDYHDATKHHFSRFARSMGYLDWASQPAPFRAFPGVREIALEPRPDAHQSGGQFAVCNLQSAIGLILRYSLGLSAWKQFGQSRPSTGSGRGELAEPRWSLRVNPSSGNLHPTEAYIIGVSGIYHYAADRHALEQR